MSIYVCSESEGNGALILGFTFQEVAARFARGCRNERVNKSTINCEDCLYFIHLDIFCCDSSAPRYVLGRDEDLDDPNKMQHFRDTNLPARCQGADQLTKDLLSLFSKVPDSFKKQYQAGKSSEKLLWLGEVATWISSYFDTFWRKWHLKRREVIYLTLGPYGGVNWVAKVWIKAASDWQILTLSKRNSLFNYFSFFVGYPLDTEINESMRPPLCARKPVQIWWSLHRISSILC